MTTTDRYGRYADRHEAGYALGDPRHNLMAALYPGDGAGESERYERPVFDVPTPRVGTVTR